MARDMSGFMVTARNHWFHAAATVKTCIGEVTKAAPGLTTFDGQFCRVDGNLGDEIRDIEGFRTK